MDITKEIWKCGKQELEILKYEKKKKKKRQNKNLFNEGGK
jgi:hypothetical protein